MSSNRTHVKIMRRRSGAVCAVLVVACAFVFVAAQGRFAAGSRGDIRLAQADTLWTHAPFGAHETSRFVVRADAAWVPWSSKVTGVGRYYLAVAGAVAPPQAWDVAATSAGWNADRAPCGPTVKVFTKTLHSKPAKLIVELDPTRTYVLAVIRFGQTPASDVRCGD